jgi:hypothetical protein
MVLVEWFVHKVGLYGEVDLYWEGKGLAEGAGKKMLLCFAFTDTVLPLACSFFFLCLLSPLIIV